jgi:hypothetical protein
MTEAITSTTVERAVDARRTTSQTRTKRNERDPLHGLRQYQYAKSNNDEPQDWKEQRRCNDFQPAGRFAAVPLTVRCHSDSSHGYASRP